MSLKSAAARPLPAFLTAAALVLMLVSLTACQARPPATTAGLAEADAFLAKNAKAPGVKVTASGLQYKVLSSGPAAGDHPGPQDEVKVDYVGQTALDGHVFDSSLDRGAPAVMGLAELVPAWKEALPMMRPGDEWILYVPPKLGYGEAGAGAVIPPNAVLVFKIKLLGVLSHGPARG